MKTPPSRRTAADISKTRNSRPLTPSDRNLALGGTQNRRGIATGRRQGQARRHRARTRTRTTRAREAPREQEASRAPRRGEKKKKTSRRLTRPPRVSRCRTTRGSRTCGTSSRPPHRRYYTRRKRLDRSHRGGRWTNARQGVAAFVRFVASNRRRLTPPPTTTQTPPQTPTTTPPRRSADECARAPRTTLVRISLAIARACACSIPRSRSSPLDSPPRAERAAAADVSAALGRSSPPDPKTARSHLGTHTQTSSCALLTLGGVPAAVAPRLRSPLYVSSRTRRSPESASRVFEARLRACASAARAAAASPLGTSPLARACSRPRDRTQARCLMFGR
mmetsp:Transcript_8885/g.32542  ORF Transcript_8885/g.32542 Transcript_8885/m.32542 type:complete len:336 (-) Transcript_8885:2735-3742(-)